MAMNNGALQEKEKGGEEIGCSGSSGSLYDHHQQYSQYKFELKRNQELPVREIRQEKNGRIMHTNPTATVRDTEL